MRRTLVALLLLVTAPALAQERWVAGDLHEHVSPPDAPGEVTATFSGCVTMAKEGGLEWLVFTPHLRDEWWRNASTPAAVKKLGELAALARAEKGLCAIPGAEDTQRAGHVGVAFIDSAVLDAILDPKTKERTRGPLLAALVAKGAQLTINHPLAGGNRKARIAEFASDLSWKAWTKPDAADADSKAIEDAASCIEVYNAGLTFAEAALGTPEKERLLAKTFAKLDQLTLATGKRWAPVGGSDNHAFWLVPTTWVRVPARVGKDGKPLPPRPEEVREALTKGRTCVAGPEASSLEARVAGGTWSKIGDDLRADGAPIEVRFEGVAELFLDGRSLGKKDGGATLTPAKGARHHLRLVRGESCSGYVYVDWEKPAPRERVYR